MNKLDTNKATNYTERLLICRSEKNVVHEFFGFGFFSSVLETNTDFID